MTDGDDTFTFQEMRIALTALLIWLRDTGITVALGRETDVVDRFMEETL